VNVICSNPHCQETITESFSTTNKSALDPLLQLNIRTIPELSENSVTSSRNTSQFVLSSRLTSSQTPTGRECKGGSKSSTSSTSSQHSGSGNRQANSRGSSGGRSGHRALSSGSSDSSEDDKDDDDKRRRTYRRNNKEPKTKFSDDEDDEATDSADEGQNEGTPNSMTLDYSPEDKPSDSRSNKYRPTHLPPKSRSSNGSSSSTISIDSIMMPKENPSAHVPQSPVNMTVGYGLPVSTTPLDNVLDTSVNDKSPTDSTKDTLGTPTVDSPRRLTGKESRSPGTPQAMSPEIPPTFPSEV